MPTIAGLLRWGAAELRTSDSPRLDAELLLAAACGIDRTALFRDSDRSPPPATVSRYRALVAARADGRPIAQLLGTREFWSLDFEVDEHCLVPRPETELLVALALAGIPDVAPQRVVDLGTGSAAIAVVLARERPRATVVAVEASAAALPIAARNIARHAADRVLLVRGDWLAAFGTGSFDLVVSNPPYVAEDDPLLECAPLRFEPRSALAAGPAGLGALARLADEGARVLVRGGRLLLEHGASQGEAVRALLAAAGFEDIATAADLAGLERVTYGTRRCSRRGTVIMEP